MKQQEKILDCICIGCDEKISCNAKVCPTCGSFQNWRRHLNLGSAIVSLLVAFLSLIVVFISQVHNLKIPDSELTAFTINVVGPIKYGDGSDHARFEVYVSNSGDRPGLIKSCSVEHVITKELVACKCFDYPLRWDQMHGESHVVLPKMSNKLNVDCPISEPSKEYSVMLGTVTHKGLGQKIVTTKVRNVN